MLVVKLWRFTLRGLVGLFYLDYVSKGRLTMQISTVRESCGNYCDWNCLDQLLEAAAG